MKKFYAYLGVASLFLFGGKFGTAQTSYSYTGTVDTYTVPAGITEIGISASGSVGQPGSSGGLGGNGATMYGEFTVAPGDVLEVFCGGNAAGMQAGGDGTYVYNSTSGTLLIVAGGGGGGGHAQNGVDAPTTESGTMCNHPFTHPGVDGAAGTGGNGGTEGNGNWGTGGGGGWFTAGGDGLGSPGGALSCRASYGTTYAGGAGGGYSGGGGVAMDSGWSTGGGGAGGSYNSGTNQSNTAGDNSSTGAVTITPLCTALTTTVSATMICVGETVTLSASSETGGTVTWDGGVSDGIAFEPPVGTTTYSATSDSPTDCAFSVDITVNDLPVIDAGEDTSVCEGEMVTLSGSGADTYVWSGGVTDGVPFIPMAGTNDYTVEGTNTTTGCSNTDVVSVTYSEIDETITVSGGTFTSNHSGISYQWVECPSYTPIAGETNQSFTPSNDGDYAVILTNNGCSDTSVCETIVGVSADEWSNSIKLYPNPSNGMYQVQLGNAINGTYSVYTSDGKVILKSNLNGSNNFTVDLTNFDNGTYIFVLTSEDEHYQIPLIKQ